MSEASRGLVVVYADEACVGNGREGDNPGGAAGLIEYRSRSGRLTRHDFWTSEPSTTNNRMALRSVIEAFRLLAQKSNRFDVVFVSDSQYLIKGMTEWVHGWAGRGWRRKTGALENVELWQEAVGSVDAQRVDWRWVRGHAGHPQNEYADHLATTAAQTLGTSGGLVPSGFEAWCDSELAADCRPEPFPDPASFRPARPLPPSPARAAGVRFNSSDV